MSPSGPAEEERERGTKQRGKKRQGEKEQEGRGDAEIEHESTIQRET